MKQLLAVSGAHIVAALNDHAYIISSHDADDNTDCPSKTASISELLPPPVKIPPSENPSLTETEPGQHRQGQTPSSSPPNPNPIQAVAIIKVKKNNIIGAVSRQDKTLCIYNLQPSSSPEFALNGGALRPTVVHVMEKRACNLSFATLSADGSDNNVTIVAADLAGDATAYPVTNPGDNNGTVGTAVGETRGEGTEDGAAAPPLANKTATKRLLLGHTASMLTGVKIVTDKKRTRVLTSDRDEKIRVSSFPQSYVVEGYLLGHSEFVSGLDVARADGVTRCVTCSGDGSVRLWDYAEKEEVALWDSGFAIGGRGGEEEGDKGGGNDVPVEGGDKKGRVVLDGVPSAVALSEDGRYVAVARHNSPGVMVLRAFFSNSDGSRDSEVQLLLRQELKSSGNPLAVAFKPGVLFVLTTGPQYLQQFILRKSDETNERFLDVTGESALCRLLQRVGSDAGITMPSTTFEFDKGGQMTLMKLRDGQPEGGDRRNSGWNNSERKTKHKSKKARQRKRKRDNDAAGADGQCGEVKDVTMEDDSDGVHSI